MAGLRGGRLRTEETTGREAASRPGRGAGPAGQASLWKWPCAFAAPTARLPTNLREFAQATVSAVEHRTVVLKVNVLKQRNHTPRGAHQGETRVDVAGPGSVCPGL